MFPGMGNMDELLSQAKNMQDNVAKLKEDLAKRVYDGQSGGGVVTAYVDGNRKLLQLEIDKEAVDPDDVEMLQDLIVSAVNAAISKARTEAKEELDGITGGMGGMMGGLL